MLPPGAFRHRTCSSCQAH
ncbi:hypothetical protein KY380_23660 [Pseudomonas sp. HD6421]|nr:hypothetical protein [Pseudomonas sp. HD6422]MCT8185740.1 hypothetical protein [Pseudomonas sp. HD6421]